MAAVDFRPPFSPSSEPAPAPPEEQVTHSPKHVRTTSPRPAASSSSSSSSSSTAASSSVSPRNGSFPSSSSTTFGSSVSCDAVDKQVRKAHRRSIGSPSAMPSRSSSASKARSSSHDLPGVVSKHVLIKDESSGSPSDEQQPQRRTRRSDPRRRASSCTPSSSIVKGSTSLISLGESGGSADVVSGAGGESELESVDSDEDSRSSAALKFYAIGGNMRVGKTRGFRLDRFVGEWDADDVSVEFPLAERRWYRETFVDHEHFNWMCKDTVLGPALLSYMKEIGSVGQSCYRVILRTKDGDQNMLLPSATVEPSGYRESPTKILKAVNQALGSFKFTRCTSDGLHQELTSWEAMQMPAHFKIGVLYAGPGQSTEEEWFSNAHGSPAFHDFLKVIGEQIPLTGHKGFRAGLDTQTEATGKFSVYTVFRNIEIMFHVSTMLPHSQQDPQQIDKKRHLGNDVVLFLFKEADDNTPYISSTISSEMIHIVFLVQPLHDDDGYRVQVVYKTGIAGFGPTNPKACIFRNKEVLRNWILTKAINGELSSYTGFSLLASKLARARDTQLTDIIERYLSREPASRKGLLSSLKMRNRFGTISAASGSAILASSTESPSPPASPRIAKEREKSAKKSRLLFGPR